MRIHHFTVPKCVDVGRVDLSRSAVTSCEHAHFGTVKWCIGGLTKANSIFTLIFILEAMNNICHIIMILLKQLSHENS